MKRDGTEQTAVVELPGIQNAVAWLHDGRILFVDWRQQRSRWDTVLPSGGTITWLPALQGIEEPISIFDGNFDTKEPPGLATEADTRVRLGTRRFFMDCVGKGSPTVVLEAPLGSASTTWSALQERLKGSARVCRYDRPNLGLTDRFAAPRTAGRMSDQLARLIVAARITRPVILVGASFGGQIAQMLTYRHPGFVRGLILLDSLPPEFDGRVADFIGHDNASLRRRQLEQNAERITFPELLQSDRELIATRKQTRVPAVVIRHGIPFSGGGGFPNHRAEVLWAKLQAKTASFFRGGKVLVATHSHHRIAEDQPGLVAAATRELIARTR
jgi:hypothetical protein